MTVSTPATGPTNGTVTVTDTIPAGLILDSMAGTDWTCAGRVTSARAATCWRLGELSGDYSYGGCV